MQVGDFVGWAHTWSDEEGCNMAGLIVRRASNGYYDILEVSTGTILESVSTYEMVVMFESR
tara:strand:- start:384 stop:566 length:183 start_codon:yes stop_codon:yes gene_type:complete